MTQPKCDTVSRRSIWFGVIWTYGPWGPGMSTDDAGGAICALMFSLCVCSSLSFHPICGSGFSLTPEVFHLWPCNHFLSCCRMRRSVSTVTPDGLTTQCTTPSTTGLRTLSPPSNLTARSPGGSLRMVSRLCGHLCSALTHNLSAQFIKITKVNSY